jgi:hypothetical protein
VLIDSCSSPSSSSSLAVVSPAEEAASPTVDPASTRIEDKLTLDIGVLSPADIESSPAYKDVEAPVLELPLSAASGPGRSDEAVEVAVKPEMEVEVADVLFEPTESERVINGFEEPEVEEAEVGRRVLLLESVLPLVFPAVAAVLAFELEIRPTPEMPCDVAPEAVTFEGLSKGEAALPIPRETALPEAPEALPPDREWLPTPRGGAAPSPKDPLTSKGFSPSLSNRERKLDRSACGICLL